MSQAGPEPAQRELVREALRLLEKRRLVFAIHDAAFPDDGQDVDVGRGTPCGRGGERLVELVARLGFDGLQLGPQGETSRGNDSPYDGTAFSRSVLSLALAPLVEDEEWRGLLRREEVEPLRAPGRGGRTTPGPAREAIRRALGLAHARLVQLRGAGAARGAELDARLARFSREQAAWLEPDARFEAMELEHGHDWRGWPPVDEGLLRRRATLLEGYRLGQLLVHEQQRRFRARARESGLVLLADLQVGVSPRDEWAHPEAFVPGWLLGAPPSRTNPEGQPWGYPVLDPLAPAALALLLARVGKLLDEADGVRVDHPHGLVTPWVYRQGTGDPLSAVQDGARLRDSPDVPELGRWAIARPDQLQGSRPRHADDRVARLEPEQVARYSVLLDALVELVRARGLAVDDLALEVLSTCPFPLAESLARHDLGRFRVTGKANVLDPRDPYLAGSARPADWIMLGTHDTLPVWALVERWRGTEEIERRASYLAGRLVPDAAGRERFARRLREDPAWLPQAMLADALASPARSLSIHFTDLLGMTEPYNVPGTVSPDNWSLRVPQETELAYTEGLARGAGLSLPLALALALRAPGSGGERAALAARLETLDPRARAWGSGTPRPGQAG